MLVLATAGIGERRVWGTAGALVSAARRRGHGGLCVDRRSPIPYRTPRSPERPAGRLRLISGFSGMGPLARCGDDGEQNVGRTVRSRSRRDHEGDYPLHRFRQAAGGRRPGRLAGRMCACWRSEGIISKDDASAILKGLEQIEQEIAEGKFVFKRELEDIHLNIEARLAETDRPGGGTAAHRALAQRSGGDRFPALGARGLRARRPGPAGAAARAGRAGREACRHHHAGLHPYAAGAAGDLRPSSAGLCRNVRARPRPLRGCQEAAE